MGNGVVTDIDWVLVWEDPPAPQPPQTTQPAPEPAFSLPAAEPKRRGGWPKGKPRKPRDA